MTAEQRWLRGDNGSSNDGGGDSWYGFERHNDTRPPASGFDRCVVRVVIDDAVASTIPITAAASADDSGTSDTTAAMAIKTAVIPNYEQNTRCSEHPANPIAAAAAGPDTWTDNDFGWRLETRAIDRVCTRETFGAHRTYGELACRQSTHDGTVGEQDSS